MKLTAMDVGKLEASIMQAIQDGLKEMVEDEVKKAQERLAVRLQKYAANTAIRLAQFVEVETIGQRIIIEVRLPESIAAGRQSE